jgi:hypothetical protein
MTVVTAKDDHEPMRVADAVAFDRRSADGAAVRRRAGVQN